MAKQSGLHQIKGKLGGFSYYHQSGVNNGLLRRINEAMSGRVKTGDEYANTRLNNAEFKNAAADAKSFGSIIIPKFRPMLLPFSQSKLTKDFLGLIKQVAGNWGERQLVAEQSDQILAALNELSKNDFESMFGVASTGISDIDPTLVEVKIGFTQDVIDKLASLGVDGVEFSCRSYGVMIGQYSAPIGKAVPNFVQRVQFETVSASTSGSAQVISSNLEVARSAMGGTELVPTIVVVAMPYRTINSVNHTLQELCSFIALPVPPAA